MNIEDIVFEYEPHGCEYTMEDNCLFTRHDDLEDWGEVDMEHCIAEGINHYEVFKHFGKEKWYVDLLFDSAQENEQEVNWATHLILSEKSKGVT